MMDYSDDAQSFYLNEQNKKKRKELKDKYGGEFHKLNDSNLPLEIENQFLNNIEQFEAQFKDSKLVKVIDIIDNQKFKSVNELSDNEIAGAIQEVLNIYAEHSINIDIIEKQDVTDRDFYIFLTERLPNEETDDINLPGWTNNFIYEDF
jgi:aspartokinase